MERPLHVAQQPLQRVAVAALGPDDPGRFLNGRQRRPLDVQEDDRRQQQTAGEHHEPEHVAPPNHRGTNTRESSMAARSFSCSVAFRLGSEGLVGACF